MSNAELTRTIAAGRDAPKDFPGMLKLYKDSIMQALPEHMNADRMARVALMCFRKNPDLGLCTPASVFSSIIVAIQLGLEPGVAGQGYLIPYKRECVFVPGWLGLVDICMRSGKAQPWTGAVYEGDDFDYALGDRPFIKHKPAGEEDPKKLTHCYAVGRTIGNRWPVIEVWPVEKIRKHRDRYNRVGEKHYSFKNFEMYGRKVPLLQVLKYLPKSFELQNAIALSHMADRAAPGPAIEEAIAGTWIPQLAADEDTHASPDVVKE